MCHSPLLYQSRRCRKHRALPRSSFVSLFIATRDTGSSASFPFWVQKWETTEATLPGLPFPMKGPQPRWPLLQPVAHLLLRSFLDKIRLLLFSKLPLGICPLYLLNELDFLLLSFCTFLKRIERQLHLVAVTSVSTVSSPLETPWG